MIVTRPYPDTKDVWAFGLAISKWHWIWMMCFLCCALITVAFGMRKRYSKIFK